MRLAIVVALAWCPLARPASAFELVAHLQPDVRALPTATTDVDARAHPENRVAKARQDAFDARIQHRNQRALASLCRGCAGHGAGDALGSLPAFDRSAGARVTAETIYSRTFGFDPAAAPTN